MEYKRSILQYQEITDRQSNYKQMFKYDQILVKFKI